MIQFQVVRWRNFLSVGNYFLEVKLNETQNTLIVGKNGAGKSILLDALCFALFGKPFRKINKPTVVNSINKKECVVELEFMIDSTQYKIVRGLAPARFEIWINGAMKPQETSTDDYQDFLEKFILKFNMKSFTQIVILGSASFTPFMELSAQDRRQIIEDLLDIQIFSAMSSLVKTRIKDNKEAVSRNKITIEAGKQKKVMQESYIADLKANREEIITEHQKEIEKNKDEILRLRSLVQDTDKAIADRTAKLGDRKKLETSIREYEKMEAKLEQALSKHKEHIDFFGGNSTCPTCEQDIQEIFRKEKIDGLTEKKDKCEAGIEQIRTKLTDLKEQLQGMNEEAVLIHGFQTTRNGWNIQACELERQNTKTEEKIREIQSRATVTSKEEEALAAIVAEIEAAEANKKTLFDEKLYLDTAATLLQDSGIKAKIIKQYIPIINTVCNKYLASLDFFVNFNLDENFNETIKSRHRDEFTYHSFSEGQKKRISMALMLTWRAVAKLKNSVDTNLLILDETFDSSLDSDGTEELMKLLHLLKENNIFVISHRGDILRDKFTNTVRFIERQNFSYIEG
jgi:DNA repair exonuclease SbcCD ATPase subunit